MKRRISSRAQLFTNIAVFAVKRTPGAAAGHVREASAGRYAVELYNSGAAPMGTRYVRIKSGARAVSSAR